MSTYCKKLTNPKTNKEQIALCIDDYYGQHKYAFVFKRDGSDITLDDMDNLEDMELDYYNKDEITFK